MGRAFRRCAIVVTLCLGGWPPEVSAQPVTDGELLKQIQVWFDGRSGSANGQYMRKGCTQTDGKLPGWRGFPVERCDYTHAVNNIEVSTTGYFLFPPGAMLAKWIVNACRDAKQADIRLCTGRLSSKIWTASNAQFPVAGYVIEPAQDESWSRSSDPYCYLFRNGVTVATSHHWKESKAYIQKGDAKVCGPEDANAESLSRAARFARISSTSRNHYVLALGHESLRGQRADDELKRIGSEKDSTAGWAAVVGEEFRRAWNSDRNALLLGTVLGGLTVCDGNIWQPAVPLPESCKLSK